MSVRSSLLFFELGIQTHIHDIYNFKITLLYKSPLISAIFMRFSQSQYFMVTLLTPHLFHCLNKFLVQVLKFVNKIIEVEVEITLIAKYLQISSCIYMIYKLYCLERINIRGGGDPAIL